VSGGAPEQHHQGRDQHAEHEEDQKEGAVPLGRLNERRPVLDGDQAPRRPRHRGIAGYHVPAVQVLGTLGTGLARHDPPDHPLRCEVGPHQRRIGVRDDAAVAVDQVDVAAHPYAKLGDVTVQRADRGRPQLEHAGEDTVELALRPGDRHGDRDDLGAADPSPVMSE